MSNHNLNAGIGIVHYIHSLIGIAGTTISNRDVGDQCQNIFKKDKTLTTEGSSLNQPQRAVLQLMITLCQKYLSILCTSNANDLLDADQFKDDCSILS